jgi:hypothetical protein
MIDGEGSVSLPPKREGGCRIVRITNTDPVLIVACRICCETLGLRYRIYRYTGPSQNDEHRPKWDLTITCHDSLRRLAASVPFLAPEKRRKLQVLLDSYKRPPYETEPSKELLIELYCVEGKSYEEIREITGARSHGTVGHWLTKHGISASRKGRLTPTKDQLVQLYCVEGKTYDQIRRIMGAATRSAVTHWLRMHDIPMNRKYGSISASEATKSPANVPDVGTRS